MNSDYTCLKKFSILIVEDDDASISALSEVLELYFQEYYRAKNGKEGLKIFQEYRPDIIITDIKMPSMNGTEMISKIREIDEDIPIFIISAFADTDTFLKAFENKISNFIIKPINVKILLETLVEKSKYISLQKKLAKEHALLQSVVNQIPDPVMVVDLERHILLLNQKMKQSYPNNNPQVCYNIFNKNETPCKGIMAQCPQEAICLSGKYGKLFCVSNENDIFDIEVQTNPLKNEQGEIYGYVKIFHDITHYKKEQKLLTYKTTHDTLTGLPNRTLLFDRINQAIQRSQRNKAAFALSFLDIDNFKNINDTYGHKAGDLLLQLFSQRINDQLRKTDTLARLSGDEFVLLLENARTKKDCEKIIKELFRHMRLDYDLEGIHVQINVSAGITQYIPDSGVLAENLLYQADTAMYDSKKHGKDNYTFFES